MSEPTAPDLHPDVCVRCATCMGICPVARVTPTFPGPKQAGPGAERFRKPDDPLVDDWIHLCLGCHLCDTVCSAGVNISELNLMAKAKYRDELGLPLRDWLLSRLSLVDGLATTLPGITNGLLKFRPFRWFLDRFLRIDARRTLPPFAHPTFRQWFRRHVSPEGRKVAYFYGCYANVHDVDVAMATVRILEAYGYAVVLPRQVCCGLPVLGQGDLKGARKRARKNVPALVQAVRSGQEVVFTSTSCGHMIKYEYSRLLQVPDADEVARHLHELFEFLRERHPEGPPTGSFRQSKLRAGYFAPCHLKALQIGLPSLEVLRRIPGLDMAVIDVNCCGLGGLYGFKKEKYPISEAIGGDLARAIRAMNPDVVVSECEGCRMQIHQLTGVPVLHPVQLLRDALVP
jgi:glycerol-3-phosphate dehydrogenase subunit C